MKVWSDISTIIKLALFCLIAGFCLGIWASVAVGNLDEPLPSTPIATGRWEASPVHPVFR